MNAGNTFNICFPCIMSSISKKPTQLKLNNNNMFIDEQLITACTENSQLLLNAYSKLRKYPKERLISYSIKNYVTGEREYEF